MIDIHCHILPGIDDGADSLQTSVMMAAIGADEGFRGVVATPHVTWDERSIRDKLISIRSKIIQFRKALAEAHIPLTCYPGAEVLCADTVKRTPTRENFPCINGTSYALVEFYFEETAAAIHQHLENLLSGGICPIIAHPERYEAIQQKKQVLSQWREMGCCLQINKNSYGGYFGRKAKKVTEWILENQLADFVASDAHDITMRNPVINNILEKMTEAYGREYITRLMVQNPMKMLRGDDLRN